MNWILEALFASALLIAAFLIIRRPVARLCGPHAAYLLWAAPALRLLLPPLPGGAGAPTQAPVHGALPTSGLELLGGAAALPTAVASPTVDWALAVLILWIAGAAAHLTWHIVGYQRFIRGALGAQAPLHTLDGIAVHAADVAGPAAAGILRRRILLPHDFADRFNPRERRLALEHEIAHHRRGDLIANWIALGVLSLHWFNPLAHVAYRAFRADQELACDATVLAGAVAADRHAYASAVVKVAWRRSPVAACPMNSADQVKARLAMMNNPGRSRLRRAVGLAAVGIVAGTALFATASQTVAALPEVTVVSPPRPEAGAALAAPIARIDHAMTEVMSRAPQLVGGVAVAPKPADRPVVPVQPSDLAAPMRREEPVAAAEVQLAALEGHRRPIVPGAPVEAAARPAEIVPAVAAAAAPRPLASLPAAGVVKASARQARNQMRSLPRPVTMFQDVRAVMVDGRYNAADPGQPYVGFCGLLRLEGVSGWLPFFVSTTPSHASGAVVKCAGPRSTEDYTAQFRAITASRRARYVSSTTGCTAAQTACVPSYYARVAQTNDAYPSAYDLERPLGRLR